MKLNHYDTINENVEYSIELSRAEDIAENGEMADTMVFSLPSGFVKNGELKWDLLKVKLKDIIEEKNYDTLSLRKEEYEEQLYIIEKEN